MPEVPGSQKMYDVGYGEKQPATPALENSLSRQRDNSEFLDKMQAQEEMKRENALRKMGAREEKEGAQKDPVEAEDITRLQALRENYTREHKRVYPAAISAVDEEKEKDPAFAAAKKALDEQLELIEKKKRS